MTWTNDRVIGTRYRARAQVPRGLGWTALVLLASIGACARGDAGNPRDSVFAPTPGDVRPPSLSPGDVQLVPSVGTACSVDGARACADNGSRLSLVCRGAAWELAATCGDDQACSNRPGDELGACLPVIAACDAHALGESFCEGNGVRACFDRVSFEDRPCSANSICRSGVDGAQCACGPGFDDIGGVCTDLDECAVANGGCDPGVECKNADGSHTCGGCRSGYLGGKDGVCTPVLIDLAVVPGTLSPSFSAVQHDYTVAVPITTATVELTASAPPGAELAINGVAITSGKAWRSDALPLGDSSFELVVSQGEAPSTRYTLVVTRGDGQDGYVKADNTGPEDGFGTSLALSADFLVVGAPGEDSGAIREDGAAEIVVASGAAYVFKRVRSGWQPHAFLKADVPGRIAAFGTVVAISGDRIVVGAPGASVVQPAEEGATGEGARLSGAGLAYVFVRDGDAWRQEATLRAGNPNAGAAFGNVAAISGDTIVVGAPLEDTPASSAEDGADTPAVPGSGAAYVFVRGEGGWTLQSRLVAPNARAGDSFGFAVALERDRAVIAALRSSTEGASASDGEASDPLGTGAQGSATTPAPMFGPGTASAAKGAAFVFARDGVSWALETELTSASVGSGARFGYSIGISGNTVVIGAPGESTSLKSEMQEAEATSVASGAAHVFVRGRRGWSEEALLVATHDPVLAAQAAGDNFGASVKIVDDTILIGAYGEDGNAAGLNGDRSTREMPNSGAAYLFTRAAKRWSEPVYIKASNTRANDEFGRHTALSRTSLAVGAADEDGGARGVGGNQADTGAANSGAVYTFH